MKTLIKNISSLVTVNANGKLYKAGADMQEIGEVRNGAMLFTDKIEWLGTNAEAEKLIAEGLHIPDKVLDMSSKTILPGFVDSHTHIVFGGNRSNEFARRLRGATYQEIAAEGGGILTTVKGTRDASIEQLVFSGLQLAKSAIKHGTTALEIKSGYGLSLDAEIKQLEAIRILKNELPIHIKSTFLGAHDFPPEYKDRHAGYVELLCNEMIPEIARRSLAEYCDAFIDKGYYTLEEGEKILKSGLANGLKLKVHCDELADFGSSSLAASLGAVSADHLLFISDAGIEDLINSGTVAALLPGTAYFIRMPYAPARKLIDRGAIAALATDCNPGSCFTENMQLILSLAVINMQMTAEEAISAATLNGARAIGISDKTGSLEIGKSADFIIADIPSYTDLFYHFGINHIEQTWVCGEKIFHKEDYLE
ncbi:MAG: imidazolonepropionase [Bacteroidota bacterium]|nr:imidazolonepropionase [Bacteroidota bacterium]